MILIQDKLQCCGCNACGEVCPKSAIAFPVDNVGFWYPLVNKETVLKDVPPRCLVAGSSAKVIKENIKWY